MKAINFLSTFLFVCLIGVNAQPAIEWQKSFGGTNHEFCWWVIQAHDNGYVLSARSRSNDGDVTGNHGGNDYWIVKTDSTGNIEWEKSIGGSLGDASSDIIQTSDKGFLIAGFSSSVDGDIHDHHGPDSTSDIFIVKLDSIGSIQWTKSYGGTNFDIGATLEPLDDGGYLVCGHTNSSDGDVSGYHTGPDPDAYDIWLFKIDSIGNLIWQKCFGGSGNEGYSGAMQTPDKGFIVYGDVFGTTDGDLTGNVDTGTNAQSVWVIKLDSSLNIQWQKTYGGTNSDEINKMQKMPGNGYLLGCSSKSNDGDVSGNHAVGEFDYWLVQIDSVGNILWQKCYGGLYAEHLFDLQIDLNGGFVLTGNTLSDSTGDISYNHGQFDLWVLKTDTSGNIIWQNCYGGSLSDFSGEIKLTSDSAYILTGYTQSNDGDVSGHHGLSTLYDAWLVKLSKELVSVDELYSPLGDFLVYPNPSNSQLNISFHLKETGMVRIRIVDISGRDVTILTDQRLSEGKHDLSWNMESDMSQSIIPGIYFLQVISNSHTVTQKISFIE